MDIAAVLDSLGIEYKRHGENGEVTEGWLGLRCPQCSPNGDRFKLGVNLNMPWVLSCWSCGKVKLWDYLIESGADRGRVKEHLGFLDRKPWVRASTKGKLIVPQGVEPMGKLHRRYLASRKLDPDEIEAVWGVQGIANAPRLPWRLFIPIVHRRHILSWTTRAIVDSITPKYLSAKPNEEVVPGKELIYGIDKAGHACAIVEGPADVWNIGPGAVATLGTSYTQAQLVLLSRFAFRLVIFDNSPAAQRRARELADQLAVFDGETMVGQLDAPDPGSASKREVAEVRRRLQ